VLAERTLYLLGLQARRQEGLMTDALGKVELPCNSTPVLPLTKNV